MVKSRRMKTNAFLRSGVVCFSLVLLTWAFIGCGGSDPSISNGGGNEPLIGTERGIRLTSHYDSLLRIGNPPIEYGYDARGPGTVGTMTYKGGGKAELIFRTEDMVVTDLEFPFIPRSIAYVKIIPTDQIGEIDFCTGEVFYEFDSKFQPVSFGVPLEAMSVVTTQTTGTSSGLFTETTGRPMDESGDLRMVSVAIVPPTGDEYVDTVLALPTDTVSELEVHFDFPDGRFPCPGHPDPGIADTVRMTVGKEGKLSMAFLGQYVTYPYDGHGSNGIGTITDNNNGVLSVSFADFAVPVMQFIPGLDIMGVRIEPNSLIGVIDICRGQIALDFDADFYPFNGDTEYYPMSVITTLRSGESLYHHHPDLEPLVGSPLDKYGDAYLVGIADVPEVPAEEDGAWITNFFLGLPNDAVSELPVHIDFLGGERPVCPY